MFYYDIPIGRGDIVLARHVHWPDGQPGRTGELVRCPRCDRIVVNVNELRVSDRLPWSFTGG